jgi:hypothetical protein
MSPGSPDYRLAEFSHSTPFAMTLWDWLIIGLPAAVLWTYIPSRICHAGKAANKQRNLVDVLPIREDVR